MSPPSRHRRFTAPSISSDTLAPLITTEELLVIQDKIHERINIAATRGTILKVRTSPTYILLDDVVAIEDRIREVLETKVNSVDNLILPLQLSAAINSTQTAHALLKWLRVIGKLHNIDTEIDIGDYLFKKTPVSVIEPIWHIVDFRVAAETIAGQYWGSLDSDSEQEAEADEEDGHDIDIQPHILPSYQHRKEPYQIQTLLQNWQRTPKQD